MPETNNFIKDEGFSPPLTAQADLSLGMKKKNNKNQMLREKFIKALSYFLPEDRNRILEAFRMD